jgi:hypothetical protein
MRAKTKIAIIIISALFALVFAFWREGISEQEDVGYFQWGAFLFSFFAVLATAGIYFLPALLAQERRHRNATAITILNCFLGWTLVGWVGALIWAIYKEKPAK